jgi:hypothetical protein
MKKIVFLLAALMLAAIVPTRAQTFKGLELGGSVQCTHQFRERGFVNVSADLRATLPVAEWSRLRALVGVNGFVPNGFDRYGYGMVGITAEALPFYVFADFGLSCNPSGPRTIGLAFDAGVGLQFEVARRWNIYTELAIDRINSGKLWQSTAAVKAGVTYNIL